MPPADRSQTERIRILRGRIQAARRATCPSCPEQGPQGPTDQSTWLSRRVGQMPYYRQIASGATVTDPCCAVCNAQTINFDEYEATDPSIPHITVVSVTDTTITLSADGQTGTFPLIYIQAFPASFVRSTVYVNNSNEPITSNFITLSPCGALIAA